MGFGPFTNSRHWRKLARAIAQPREIRQADRQTLLRAKARGLHQLHVIPLDLAGDSFRPLVRRHEDLDAELLRDRKSTRLTPVTNAHLVCRLLLAKNKTQKQVTTINQLTNNNE